MLPILIFSFFEAPFSEIVMGAGYGVLIGLMGISMFLYAVVHLSAPVVGLFSFLEIPTTIFVGTVILGEPLTFKLILGGVMIVIST